MKKEDWIEVERELRHEGGMVRLQCDQYELLLVNCQVKPMRLGFMFYVNDTFSGQWLMEDCEERRRFFRPVKLHLWNENERKWFRKFSKKALRAAEVDPDVKSTSYSYYWTSFAALKRHLMLHNREISRIGEAHGLGAESHG